MHACPPSFTERLKGSNTVASNFSVLLLTASRVSGPPAVHLQYMQKKNPMYSQLKEDTVWSMESFNTYVNDKFQVAKGLPRDWVMGAFAVSTAARRSSRGPITVITMVVGARS